MESALKSFLFFYTALNWRELTLLTRLDHYTLSCQNFTCDSIDTLPNFSNPNHWWGYSSVLFLHQLTPSASKNLKPTLVKLTTELCSECYAMEKFFCGVTFFGQDFNVNNVNYKYYPVSLLHVDFGSFP